MKRFSSRFKAECSLLLVSFIWGSTFVLVKEALNSMAPYTFLGIRFLLAGLFLVLLTWRHFLGVPFRSIVRGAIIGLALLAGYIFQTVGLLYTSASHAGFITGLSVVMVPLFSAVYTKRLPGPWSAVGVLAATAGLFLLSVTSTFEISLGDGLVFGCAIAFALHILLVARYSPKTNPVVLTVVQILFVGLICMIIGLSFEPRPVIDAPVIQALAITSIPATALAFLIQNAVQRYTTATRTAMILITEPVFAAAFAYMWVGETQTLRALIGCCLIVFGMIFSEIRFGPRGGSTPQT
ncbi:MAG: DMT family transporter [Solirubrobacterales bacterium]